MNSNTHTHDNNSDVQVEHSTLEPSVNSQNTKKTPKNEMFTLMVELFEIIGNLNITEGEYLVVADIFKNMNSNLNRLQEIRDRIISNTFYRRNHTTVQHLHLTEAQKANNPHYLLCNCGRYVSKKLDCNYVIHLKSQVHYQGRRNRKYSTRGWSNEKIDEAIYREVTLQAFLVRHITKIESNH